MSGGSAGFREAFRSGEIGPHYSGWGHFAFTTLGSLAVIVFAASRVERPTALELALLPVFFLIATLTEYFAHKGPMHHRRPGLGVVFKRHTLQHHAFFTEQMMECDTSRDFKIILFPPVMLAFVVGITVPLGAVFYVLVSPNAGFLFAAVAIGYFLTYEWLHFAYHQPASSWVSRIPGVAALRRHHQAHHDAALMTRWNFNITFPIGDRIFGTSWKEKPTD